jgi:hypothetical protein
MFKVTILFLLILPFSLFPQQNDKIIAKIGNIEISEQKFLERYELTPVLGKEIKSDAEALKEEVLHALIAEKLFSLKAQEMNIDTSEIVKRTLEGYEKLFVRDALYKKEIREKAAHTADSLLTLYVGKASQVWFTYITAANAKEINNIYAILKRGATYDSVYTMFNPTYDTLKTRIGDHDAAVEEEIFNVREQSYTKPVFMDGTWYILKIVKRINPVLTHLNGWEEEYKRLKKTADDRAEQIYYKNYMLNFFKDKKIKANGNLLQKFAAKVEEILEKKTLVRKSDSEKVFLNNIDILKIESELDSKDLNSTYIKLNNKPVTLKDFISYFRFEIFGTDKVDYKTILDLLNIKTRHFIEQELLAREGYKQGLNELASVKDSYKMWRDNYYYYLLRNMFNDSTSVSDQEVLQYYAAEEAKDDLGDEIKISEIKTDSLSSIENILNEIDEGKNFEVIAQRFNPENESPEFAPEASFGEIGNLSKSMKVGEIYGPVKTGDKYTIFKLLDRRRKKEQASFESEKENIKKILEEKKYQEKLINFTTSLAMKYGFSINEDALSALKVTSLNSMVYQMLGFGGKIPAVPLSLPSLQWYNNWKEKHDILQ